MARAGEGNTPQSTSSTAPMRVIEQPIVIGAANNEVRKSGPVACSCGCGSLQPTCVSGGRLLPHDLIATTSSGTRV